MRFEHWSVRLTAVIAKYRRLGFERGKRDCVFFAAECVWCLTQKNAAEPWRGRYTDEAGAAAIIAEAGGLEALVESGLAAAGIEYEIVAPSFAQRGDVLLIQDDGEPSVGIAYGDGILTMTKTGLATVPMNRASKCWAFR